MIPASVMTRLAMLGLDEGQAETVAEMLAAVEAATKDEAGQAIAARRASDRERKSRQRHGKSRDVTGQDVTSGDNSSPSLPKRKVSPCTPSKENTLSSPTFSEPNGSSNKRSVATSAAEFADEFWPAYPNKVGKPDAFKKFEIARRSASLEDIMAGLARYVATKPPDRNWCNPATWLNQGRWTDEPAKPPVTGASHVNNRPTPKQTADGISRAFANIAARRGEPFASFEDHLGQPSAPDDVPDREITIGRREDGHFGDDPQRSLRVVGSSRY